jgi:ribonuclease-3
MEQKRRSILLELLNNPYLNIEDVDDSSLILYDQALTHSSFAKEQRDKGLECKDNERLEFFGNFVLGLVVSEYLFNNFDLSEGEMTKRMVVVSDAKLAEIIKKKEIAIDKKSIMLGKREIGRTKKLEDSIIACAFEAFIAAVFIDKGIDKAKEIINNLLNDEIKNFAAGSNYIGRLQEMVQQNKIGKLEYIEQKLTGPDHKPTFKAVAKISGLSYGEGVGKNKKAAKMQAAAAAIKRIKKTKFKK